MITMENDLIFLMLVFSPALMMFFSPSPPSPSLFFLWSPFLSFYVHGSSVWSSHFAPEIGATHSKGVFFFAF